jgi:hypothetical protein
MWMNTNELAERLALVSSLADQWEKPLFLGHGAIDTVREETRLECAEAVRRAIGELPSLADGGAIERAEKALQECLRRLSLEGHGPCDEHFREAVFAMEGLAQLRAGRAAATAPEETAARDAEAGREE